MPQKRNPVALEHARAIGSKALGQTQAILLTIHNTPFGDIVDTEDDLQPLVFAMFRDATRVVTLVAAAMKTAEFDRVKLEARAGAGWTTLTELADTLVRDHGLPFKTAHTVAARLVALAAEKKGAPAGRTAARGVDRCGAGADSLFGRRAEGGAQPAAVRRSPPDSRRAGARRDGAGRRRNRWTRSARTSGGPPAAVSALADADRRLRARLPRAIVSRSAWPTSTIPTSPRRRP